MSLVKTKLKATRDAISKKDFISARDSALTILDYESDNYNANVFLGLALLELGEKDESEKAYRKAITAAPDQILAWQGLSKLYEKLENWTKYPEVLHKLMYLYSKASDPTKCAENVQKLVNNRRSHGTKLELIEALSLYLPSSAVYPTLSMLPAPNLTKPTDSITLASQSAIYNPLPVIEEIIKLTKAEEDMTYRTEVDKRRMRLGAPPLEILKADVGREIWTNSKIPSLYSEILNHPQTTDELRRSTESALLEFKVKLLHAFPAASPEKMKVRSEVEELVNGAILLNLPDELAWSIYINGQDVASNDGYALPNLQKYTVLFPASPLTRLLRGYFRFLGTPTEDDEAEEKEDVSTLVETDDPIDTILDSYNDVPDSIISNRIVAKIYLEDADYDNAIKICETGIALLQRTEFLDGKKLPNVRIFYNVILATSLVHFFPPKNHVRALGIIDEVLSADPNNTKCLMGRGYILEYSGRWREAQKLFEAAGHLLAGDNDDGLRCKEEYAWCIGQSGNKSRCIELLREVIGILEGLEGTKHDLARALYRLGVCRWDLGGLERDDAYILFINALKRNPEYAPAFTALGIHYLEHASPIDPVRASKCFQKAFELDPCEVLAARRLAEGFADEREWDLVDVIARRTIQGEGSKVESDLPKEGEAAIKDRYLPLNAWAWKAVGVVALVNQKYPQAIQALQVALRTEPKDPLSWLRLGESYSKAGQHAAALKALERAHELQPDNWVCIYLIAELHSQMGNFEFATKSFEKVLESRPVDVGTLIAAARNCFHAGASENDSGFIARSELSYVTSMRLAFRAIEVNQGFRHVAWKVAGDACLALSARTSYYNSNAIFSAVDSLRSLLGSFSNRIQSFISSNPSVEILKPQHQLMDTSIQIYDHRISLDVPLDIRHEAWFDLGIACARRSRMMPDDNSNKTLDAAIFFLTSAVKYHAGIPAYWAALGNIFFVKNWQTAQHAYIKALEIDNKDPSIWAHLGLLYYYHSDLELANEALYRAQTLDPDSALAWLGQGIVATANGHFADAGVIFEHIITLSTSLPTAGFEFSSRKFAERLKARNSEDVDLLPVFATMSRYAQECPDDASGLQLFGLVCEQLGQYELAAEMVQKSIEILEAQYEEAEDLMVERQFIMANCNKARLGLYIGDSHGAVDAWESALGLLPDEITSDDSQAGVIRTQAELGMGLALWNLGELQEALLHFERAIEGAGQNIVMKGHAIVLLAQTNWVIGSAESKEAAQSLLLECISEDPENLQAVAALAGMGILNRDDDLVDAALFEILALPIERRHELDPARDIPFLLCQHQLNQGDILKASAVLQAAIMAEPSRPSFRQDLASLTLQNVALSDEKERAKRALAIFGPPLWKLHRADNETRVIAEILTGDHLSAKQHAQQGIFQKPSKLGNWIALAYAQARTAA